MTQGYYTQEIIRRMDLLSRPTTFVLGAGASKDLELPLGSELQDSIKTLLRVGPDNMRMDSGPISDVVQQTIRGKPNWSEEAFSFFEASNKICRAMPFAASIDNFLHAHQDDPKVVMLGKLAIARAIIEAEENSSLGSRRGGEAQFIEHEYEKSWYAPFIKMLTAGTKNNNVEEFLENCAFVVFNYDRCLEKILHSTLVSYFGKSVEEAYSILSTVTIIHPYGSLGPLDPDVQGCVNFGDTKAPLSQIAERIKTFTESVDENLVSSAKSAIANAHSVIFMGFGFVTQNLELLFPTERKKTEEIYATTVGFSNTDKIIIREFLKGFLSNAARSSLVDINQIVDPEEDFGYIDLNNSDCSNLISNHRFRLMSG